MRIALHGKEFIDESIPYIQQIIDQLTANGIEIIYSQSFAGILNRSTVRADTSNTYSKLTESTKPDYIISIGGDGTLLSTVTQVRQLPIPILGINTGRLGFLATISKLEISTALEAFLNDDFTTEERTLLRLETDEHLFGELNFCTQ